MNTPHVGADPRGRGRLVASASAFVFLSIAWLSLPHARAQQPPGPTIATGNYVRVATWEDAAVNVPTATWRSPAGIATLPGGRVVTVDRRLRRVEVLSPDGRGLVDFGRGTDPDDLASPGHVAVDPARNRAYVADPGAARVAVYDLGQGGSPVALWTLIAGPSGVAVGPDGRVFVSDLDGNRIRVFTPDGQEVGGWGGFGTGWTQYDGPAGVDVSPDGTVYVADRINKRVVSTTSAGQPVERYKMDGPAAGLEPLDVAVKGDDVWAATSSGLVRFDRRSGDVKTVLGDSHFAAVAMGDMGLVVTADPVDGYPGVFFYLPTQSTGEPKTVWGAPLSVPGFFDGPETVAVGDDGLAYLLDVPPRVQRVGLDGTVQLQIEAPDPIEVDADSNGNVYTVADDQVYSYSVTGTLRWQAKIQTVGLAGRDLDITGLAWDESSRQLAVLDATSQKVYFYGADGKSVDSWSPAATKPDRDYWSDMVILTDGRLFLLDSGNHQVLAYAPLTRARTAILDTPEAGVRIDVGADGRVAVLSASGWTRVLAADGSVIASWDTTRLDHGGSSRPSDLAFDPAGRLIVADRGADVASVFAWDPQAARTEPPQVTEGCQLVPTKTASPGEIALGQTVEIALTVRGACAPSQGRADIVLVIDTSMDKGRFRAAQKAVDAFLQRVDPATDQVAVQPTRLNVHGQVGSRLTSDIQLSRRAMRKLEPAYDEWELKIALEDAEKELFGIRGRPDAKKVVILLLGSDGIPARYCDPQLRRELWRQPGEIDKAAGHLRGRGAEIHGVWLSSQLLNNPDCTVDLLRIDGYSMLRDIVGDTDRLIKAPSKSAVAGIYSRILTVIKPTVLLRELVITDTLPANMVLVESSSEPPAVVVTRTNPAGGPPLVVLSWRLVDVPLAGAGFRYRLRPTEAGVWPTNVEAVADTRDPENVRKHLVFPVPEVRVLVPSPTPTRTDTPTPTPTHTPTDIPATPTWTPEPTPPPTPTPKPRPVYLPLALGEECKPELRLADIVLVIDASSSMSEQTRGGRPKIDAARDAAGRLLDKLQLGRVKVAVVSFNNDAAILVPLSADRSAIDRALASITLQTQTRLDLGVAAGYAAVSGPDHRPDAQAGMILLTDGRANPVGPEVAVAKAAEAKAAGVKLITIGLGNDLDLAALQEMASSPEDFHQAADAEDLAVIYEALVGAVPCPASSFWGRR